MSYVWASDSRNSVYAVVLGGGRVRAFTLAQEAGEYRVIELTEGRHPLIPSRHLDALNSRRRTAWEGDSHAKVDI